MNIKPPAWKRTYTFFKRLADYTTFGAIAQKCGKEIQTAEAWARVPESEESPHGTGKRNPMDCVLRLIALAHGKDGGLAREMAAIFPEYVAYLDSLSGGAAAANGDEAINELVAASAKEHLDIVLELMKAGERDLAKIWSEVKQAESALAKVGACLEVEIKRAAEKQSI